MAGDQVTVKVHKYVKRVAEQIQTKLKKKDIPISEIAIYDAMAIRIEEDFKKMKMNDFVESVMNDLNDLRSSKDVKIKYRSTPSKVD